MQRSNHFVRVLLVDDYEPFRRFVRATLQARSELEVIGEASDGLEAVQKAKELQPDLICLTSDSRHSMESKWHIEFPDSLKTRPYFS